MMGKETLQPTTRRGFFAHLGRWVAGGALAAGTLALVARPTSQAKSQTCLNPQPRAGCRGCAALTDCGLPQALSLKKIRIKEPQINTDEHG